MPENEPEKKLSNPSEQSRPVQEAPLPKEEALPVLVEMKEELGKALQKELSPYMSKQKAGDVNRVVQQVVSSTINHITNHRNTVIIVPGDEENGLKSEEIHDMMKVEQKQRHRWDNRNAWFQFIYAMSGLTFGLIASIALILAAWDLGHANQKEVAIALTTASAVGIVYAFVKASTIFNPKNPSTEVAEQKKPTPRRRKP